MESKQLMSNIAMENFSSISYLIYNGLDNTAIIYKNYIICNSTSGIYPQRTQSRTQTDTPNFIAASFILSKR